jgi:DNA-binding response OmpR family regulator/two-component sensor histidine kinase
MSTRPPAVLLNVDDNEIARYARSRTLRHAGFEVLEAASGAQALVSVDGHAPALVLLDVQLPDVSGIEVCREIKRRWPTVLVLQTSAAFVSSEDRIRGFEGGADAYLIQPIDPEELVATVRALMRLHDAEEAARTLNETLEQRIEARTAELHATNRRLQEQITQRERAESALVQAQKMEAVGQLTGAMAHDFNNLLAGLVNYLHLIRLKSTDESVRGYADKALAAADRGAKLTKRLLSFSRMDQLQTLSADMRRVVSDMHDWLAQSVGSTIEIRVEIDEGDVIAVTDTHQLELALLNMVLNSRDAMPGGGTIVITVRRQRAEAPEQDGLVAGDYVLLTVTDTGECMPPEVMARCFDPFFTTKPVGRGTGLGLAQVSNLARRSGGTTRIESAPGRGTSVSLWLPAGERGNLPLAPLRRLGEDVTPGGGESVLLVDDDEDVLRTTAAMLVALGYSVTGVANAEAGLAQLSAVPADLLLLDFEMPGVNGLALARRVRERHPQQRILFMSGHAEIAALDREVAGAQLLRKPFREWDLSAAVRRALDRSAPG